MRSSLRKHKRLTAVVVVTAAIVVFVVFLELRPEASIRGQRDARSDIARGNYRQLGFGLVVMPELPEEYARLLRERYGIEYEKVADDLLTESEVKYFTAYNAVSTEAANRRFGHDVFKECSEDSTRNLETARTRREASYRAAIVPFQRDLPIGMGQPQVQKYLDSKKLAYKTIKNVGTELDKFEIEIGEEPGDIGCHSSKVYVALEFDSSDKLQGVHFFDACS